MRLGQVVTKQRVMTLGVASFGAGVGLVATSQALRRLSPAGLKPHWRALIQIAAGVIGGLGLAAGRPGNGRLALATGFGAGAVGGGISNLVMGFLDQAAPVNLGGVSLGRMRTRGADIYESRPGAPRLAPGARPSPLGRFGAAVISEQTTPAYLA